MGAQKLKILVVDDEKDIGGLLISLAADDYQGIYSSSAEDALVKLKEFSSEIVCVISDYKMDGMTGLDLLNFMRKDYKEIPFILVSGFVTREEALAGIEVKSSSFISKPFNNDLMLAQIKRHGSERASLIQERKILEQIFIEESSSIVEDLEPLIMSLEQKPNDMEALNTIFRLVHTIKGSSGVLETTHIRSYVHKYEDLLSKLKTGAMVATPEIVSILLKGFDIVGQMIAALRSGKPWTKDVSELAKIFDNSAASGAQAAVQAAQDNGQTGGASRAEQGKETVNVPAAMLDEFMELSGEITVIRNMVNKLVRVIEKEAPGNRNVQQLGDLLDEMHKINSGMQGRLVETRKVALSKVFRPLPRTVRDTARSLGKTIQLKIEGDHIRVDTSLASALSESLVHIVRNSLDHGIEPKEKRLERKKNPQGTIIIRAEESGDEVIISIQDDGGGLDMSRIKSKAVERGLYSAADIEALSAQKIYSLIFESGFSTAQQVTDVSGRGVGMDMVRSSIQKVKGRIDIDSELGRGTKFALHMPIPKSVLIISSLVVEAAGSTFALPQDSIARLLRLEGQRVKQSIKQLEGTFVLDYEGDLVPIADLGETLGLRPARSVDYYTLDTLNLLIVNTDLTVFALAVDRILDSEEIVVKAVGKFLEQAKVYSGATFMGDGSVGLILNAEGLAAKAGVISSRAVAIADDDEQVKVIEKTTQEILLFSLWCQGSFGVPLNMIHRLEELRRDTFQVLGDRRVVIYREQTVPLLDMSEILGMPIVKTEDKSSEDLVPVFVIMLHDRYVAFVIREIKDVCLAPISLDVTVRDRDEIAGTVQVNGHVVSVLDIFSILDKAGILKTFDPEGVLGKFAHGSTTVPEEILVEEEQIVLDKVANGDESPTTFAGDGWGLF